MLATPTIPAWAAGSDPAPISMASSVRSFPKHPDPHRSFIEAVSTDVDGSWVDVLPSAEAGGFLPS